MAEPYQVWVNQFYQRKRVFTATEDGSVPASGGGTTTFLRADGTWAIPSGGGGGSLSDGDYGDIVVSGSATVFTIDSGVVTNAKMANVSTQTFKGRTTAGTGSPEDLTVAQAKTLLSLSGSNTGDQTITLTGDVTGSGTGSFAATIANDAVTYAKLQNVSATARFIGRITSGAGDAEEMTGTQATTLLDAFTSGLKGLVPASGGGTTNFLRADGTFAAPPTGSGAAATYGTVDIDFGSTPGTNVVTVTVTGQTGVLTTSNLQAWVMAEASTNHNAYEHMIVPLRLTCGNIVAGTGFDIVAVSDLRLTGIFKCRWMGDF